MLTEKYCEAGTLLAKNEDKNTITATFLRPNSGKFTVIPPSLWRKEIYKEKIDGFARLTNNIRAIKNKS
ncbi:hypothetical protein AKJ44_02205 [candidate division MSBL1 archaeon SCGC-AAA261F17]|uniref:Uncharacterized protein n=1 Tax=candidate division MSBL1 archaeon SCGC-AAA261F17 TaxID=1698274 RepID=A0A133V5M2_9EURY|nr:hypothetical protein AKJ44_02205 [candidate division MSBL1 archaeon SCGC-AAA261F17]